MATEDYREDLGEQGRFKTWLQDNIRIILSVLIVIAVAAMIYSYSRRAEVTDSTNSQTNQEQTDSETGDEANKDANENGENEDSVKIVDENKAAKDQNGNGAKDSANATDNGNKDNKATNGSTTNGNNNAANSEVADGKGAGREKIATTKEQNEQPKEKAAVKSETKNSDSEQKAVDSSKETDEAFEETVGKGDNLTLLARRALAGYLSKNNDSGLTAEHKVFVEDYLRLRVGHKAGVTVGEKVTFSKSLIKEAVEKSKGLSENQLSYLKRFSSRIRN